MFALESGAFFKIFDLLVKQFVLFFFHNGSQPVLALRPGLYFFRHLFRIVQKQLAPVRDFARNLLLGSTHNFPLNIYMARYSAPEENNSAFR
jgi:hypothetical protein